MNLCDYYVPKLAVNDKRGYPNVRPMVRLGGYNQVENDEHAVDKMNGKILNQRRFCGRFVDERPVYDDDNGIHGGNYIVGNPRKG